LTTAQLSSRTRSRRADITTTALDLRVDEPRDDLGGDERHAHRVAAAAAVVARRAAAARRAAGVAVLTLVVVRARGRRGRVLRRGVVAVPAVRGAREHGEDGAPAGAERRRAREERRVDAAQHELRGARRNVRRLLSSN
jgi:hypothetical protein